MTEPKMISMRELGKLVEDQIFVRQVLLGKMFGYTPTVEDEIMRLRMILKVLMETR